MKIGIYRSAHNSMEAVECCPICINTYTGKVRKAIECPTCDFKCCLDCFKTHTKSGGDIMCMNPDCRSVFPEKFIREHLPNSFIKKEYGEARKDFLWDSERGMMPETQPIVEATIELSRAEKELKALQEEYRVKMAKKKQEMVEAKNIISGLKKSDNAGRRTFLSKCPHEGCQGYLNGAYNCGICGHSTCSKCFQIKGEDHVCNEDDVKTAELIRSDTKGCPSCGELIHKIHGCDQMWCPSCSTAFSWKTGKIVTGVIHNPHYFEYRNRNGGNDRNVRDIPCGGLIGLDVVKNETRKIGIATDRARVEIDLERCWRFAAELRDDITTMTAENDRFNSTKDLRIKFMMNEITEESFKKQLLRRDNQSMKNREVVQVYNTIALLIEDQLRNITAVEGIAPVLEIVAELGRIIDYGNEIFLELAKTYKVSMPKIVYPTIKAAHVEHVVNGFRNRHRYGYYNQYYRESQIKILKSGQK